MSASSAIVGVDNIIMVLARAIIDGADREESCEYGGLRRQHHIGVPVGRTGADRSGPSWEDLESVDPGDRREETRLRENTALFSTYE